MKKNKSEIRPVEPLPDVVWIKLQADEIKRLAVELGKERAFTQELQDQIKHFKKWRKTFNWEVKKELLKEEEYFKMAEKLRNIRQENKRLKDEILNLKIKLSEKEAHYNHI